MENNKGEIAAAYRAESVTLRTLAPGKVRIIVTKRDPLRDSRESPWLTAADSDTRSEAIEVGRTESGDRATVNLFSTSLLIGGNPGSGKSAAMTNIVAALALDPQVELHLVDAKGGVELRQWEPCAERFADTLESSTPLLEDLLSKTLSRFDVLKGAGLKKWRAEDGSIALVIDELAEITGSGSKASKEAAETLRRIIALGRAAGVSVIVATQKPDSTTVPTAIRDMMAQRLGLRCGARGQADVIIPELGEELTRIPLGLPGVGYITNQQGGYERMRAYFIPDDAVAELAHRAAQHRSEHVHAG